LCYSYCSADFIFILRISNALPFCQNILVILTSFYSSSPKGCLSNVLVLRYKSELLYLRMSSLQNWPGKNLDTKAYTFSFISPVTVCQSKSAIFCSMFFIYSTLVNRSISYQSSSNLFEDILLLKLLIRNKLFPTTVIIRNYCNYSQLL